ncbi:hypothetical protein GXW82_11815 [Streptacidiphilus sp. 4-A2]|nr:hypothetical protein [Streptacidiphilus sp. 4-A2]
MGVGATPVSTKNDCSWPLFLGGQPSAGLRGTVVSSLSSLRILICTMVLTSSPSGRRCGWALPQPLL